MDNSQKKSAQPPPQQQEKAAQPPQPLTSSQPSQQPATTTHASLTVPQSQTTAPPPKQAQKEQRQLTTEEIIAEKDDFIIDKIEELYNKDKQLKKAQEMIDKYADELRMFKDLVGKNVHGRDRDEREDRRIAKEVFAGMTKHIKPFTGDKNDNFFLWWTKIMDVLRYMGDTAELLRGDSLFSLIGEDVVTTLGTKIVGFGNFNMGRVAEILRENFVRPGDDPYDKLFEWKFDENKQFKFNLGKFNSLVMNTNCSMDLKRHAWIKAIPDVLSEELMKCEDDWKDKDWKVFEALNEKLWKRLSIEREYREKRNKNNDGYLKDNIDNNNSTTASTTTTTTATSTTATPTRTTVNVVQQAGLCFN